MDEHGGGGRSSAGDTVVAPTLDRPRRPRSSLSSLCFSPEPEHHLALALAIAAATPPGPHHHVILPWDGATGRCHCPPRCSEERKSRLRTANSDAVTARAATVTPSHLIL
jgi:hypothetical protein